MRLHDSCVHKVLCRGPSMQAYVDNSVAVEPELLSEAQGFLQLLANVDSDDTAAVVLELRKCCGAALKWARR